MSLFRHYAESCQLFCICVYEYVFKLRGLLLDLLLMFFYCICINESLTITETESLPSQDFLGSLQRLKDVLSEVECKQQAIASGLSDPSKVEKALQQTKVILIFFSYFVPRSPKEGVRAQDCPPS